jgi:hypothetical protein
MTTTRTATDVTDEQRIAIAHEELRLGRSEMAQAQSSIDPVAKRRCQARAAAYFRRAADWLDDNGALEE